MSDLLKSWLSEEVGLQLKDVEQDFASGFMFGQLLEHYSMQPDFDKFEVKRTPDAMINNFTRLQTSFQKLGIKFDSRTANAVMREEPGVALRLLYALRQSLGQVQKDVTKFQHSGRLGKELGASVSMTRALLDAQQHNTAKEKHVANNLKFFEETMRSRAENPNALMESMHLRKYMEQMYRQERQASAGTQQDKAALAAARATFRSAEMAKLESARKDKGKKLEHDDAIHAALLKHKEDLEREELRVELALSEKARRKKLEELSHASLDVSLGIDAFEINLKRLVKVEGSAEEGAAVAAGATGPVQGSPLEHMTKMKGMSVPVGKVLEGSQGYLAGVKAQRAEDVATKREREARRRKVLVEQQQAAENAAAKLQEEALVATLARQSAEEQRLAERMWQLRQEKEAMKEDRVLREQQYHERREKDWEDTLMREVELHRSMKEQYAAAAAAEMEAWRAAQAQRAQAKAAKRGSMCRDVAWQLVQLAERTAEFRFRTGCNPPMNEFRRWVAMFIAGDPALGTPIVQVDLAAEEARAAQLEAEKRVARAIVEDYLDCSGEFKRQEDGEIGLNAVLGTAVSDLVSTCSPPPAEQDLPALPYPLRLAVVGAPFAGKTSVAHELASRFQLRVLDVEQLVQAAMKEAEAYDAAAAASAPPAPAEGTAPATEGEGASAAGADTEGADAAPAPVVPPLVLLGREAAEKLHAGQDVSDDLVVAVLVLAMQDVGKRPLTPVVELDAKGKPKAPAKKGGASEEPLVAQGFVVDGFPRTQAQSVLLERALTGLDLDKEAALVASASRLAPAPPGALPQLTRPLRSGLDAVLVLGLTDEATALKRALGRRLDPQTGRVYHLEFDPPPSNDPGLNARLQEVSDDSNNAVQIQRRLTAYTAEAAELDEWLKRFIKLRHPVDGFGPRSEVMESATDVAAGIIRAKQAVASAKASVVAAAKARAAAEKAQEYAELARGHAEAAARELLSAKKAEIAAAALLADPKSKVQDAAATEVLKAQSAAKCAESLKVCKAAAQDAAGYAERAAEAAAAAGEAKARAESSLGDAEVNASAEAEAKVHAEEAEIARQGAAEAAAKAEAARAAAEFAAAEAEKLFAADTVAPDATLELASDIEAKAAAEAEAAAKAAAAERNPSESLPKQPVPGPLARALLEEWRAIEGSYIEGLVMAFVNLAEQSGVVVQHFDTTRQTFTKLLQRPDGRAALVTQFQQQYNALDVDARKLKETQGEMVLRAEELRDTLWALCDKKMEDAEAERSRLGTEAFVSEQATVLGQYYSEVLQVELDRCMSTLSFLRGYTAARFGVLPDASEASVADHSDSNYEEGVFVAPDLLAGTVPHALKEQLDEKSKQCLQFPAWLTALSGKSAPLVTALKIAYATLVGLKGWLDPSSVEESKSKGKGKDAKGKGGDESAHPIDPVVKQAIDTEMRVCGAREVEILEGRLALLAERAQAALASVTELATTTHSNVGQCIKTRYEAECSAVYALDCIIKAAAVAGEPLSHDLRLEDDGLTLDQSALVVARPPGLPAPAPRERQPPAGLLSTGQMSSLVRLFKAMSPDGWMRLGDAAQLLCSCTADGVLPAGWQGSSHSELLGALRAFDPTSTGYVDWREVVCSLAAAAFPSLMQASCAEMGDQVFMLSEVDENKDGYLTEAQWNKVELWFQYKTFLPGSEEDLDAGAAAKQQKAAYDSATALKSVLWDTFSQPLPGGSASDVQINIRATLLYLCPTRDMFLGIKKAFSVATASTTAKAEATSAITTNARADAQQVFSVVYPLGPDAGKPVARSPFSFEDVQQVVQTIYDSRKPASGSAAAAAAAASSTPLPTPPYVAAEQLMYSAAGERLVVHQLHRYQWKDLYVATKMQ